MPNRSYTASDNDTNYIISQLPKKLLEIEVPKLWILEIVPTEDSNVMLAPHVDGVRKTAINIYSNTNGERTCYYEYGSGGSINEVDSFVAKDDDIWLMDVAKPHAVELVPNKVRRVLTLSFITTPYEIVRQALV